MMTDGVGTADGIAFGGRTGGTSSFGSGGGGGVASFGKGGCVVSATGAGTSEEVSAVSGTTRATGAVEAPATGVVSEPTSPGPTTLPLALGRSNSALLPRSSVAVLRGFGLLGGSAIVDPCGVSFVCRGFSSGFNGAAGVSTGSETKSEAGGGMD